MRQTNLENRMRLLRTLAVCVSALCLAASVTGIQTISVRTFGTVTDFNVTHMDILGRFFAFLIAIIFAVFALGIQVRAKITWKSGFILLALGYINFAVSAAIATHRVALAKGASTPWLLVALVAILGAAVSVFWGIWWKRQRAYFFPAD
ncbi:MAG: hypothetical protein ACTHLO_02745 [Pseudolabrys sp.]